MITDLCGTVWPRVMISESDRLHPGTAEIRTELYEHQRKPCDLLCPVPDPTLTDEEPRVVFCHRRARGDRTRHRSVLLQASSLEDRPPDSGGN